MPRALLLSVLLALAPRAAAQELLRIEGLQGRVETLGGSRNVELLTGLGPRDCPGPGLLEAGSMASARLFWPGRASLETQGRAGLEWRGNGEIFLRVFELQHGELEVRRGPLLLELPWGWHASFENGAYRLRSLPGGALEIENVAGFAPRLWWSRVGLLRCVPGPGCGERALLPPDWTATSRAQRETHAPWAQASWPWGSAPERLAVTVEPAAGPAPEVAAPPPLPPFDPGLWRGCAREQLELAGSCAVERRDDLAVEIDAHGDVTLRLRSDAARPAWVWRQDTDLELAPGTLVVLDAQGLLLANLGPIRVHAPPRGRPAPAASGIAPR
jgi:hypothetical protein